MVGRGAQGVRAGCCAAIARATALIFRAVSGAMLCARVLLLGMIAGANNSAAIIGPLADARGSDCHRRPARAPGSAGRRPAYSAFFLPLTFSFGACSRSCRARISSNWSSMRSRRRRIVCTWSARRWNSLSGTAPTASIPARRRSRSLGHRRADAQIRPLALLRRCFGLRVGDGLLERLAPLRNERIADGLPLREHVGHRVVWHGRILPCTAPGIF